MLHVFVLPLVSFNTQTAPVYLCRIYSLLHFETFKKFAFHFCNKTFYSDPVQSALILTLGALLSVSECTEQLCGELCLYDRMHVIYIHSCVNVCYSTIWMCEGLDEEHLLHETGLLKKIIEKDHFMFCEGTGTIDFCSSV